MTQAQALSILKTGANVFLTGEPGSGKTHIINEFVKYLRGQDVEPAITASTGIAATHIGGVTIHSWSGIGIKTKLDKHDLDRIASTKYIAKRVRNSTVLIIDEVSMLPPGTFSMIDAICRKIKNSSESFGGLQVVLVGDFFQLPPIINSIRDERPARATEISDGLDMEASEESSVQIELLAPPTAVMKESSARFAFDSSDLLSANLTVCYLTEQHRQDDSNFLAVLSAIRSNNFNSNHLRYIESRKIERRAGSVEAPKLFSHNVDVDRVNSGVLAKLPGEPQIFTMSVRGPSVLVAALQKGCLSPETLQLKVGAAVMFTKNNPKDGFVNGTLGSVIGFNEVNGYPIVKARSGRRIEVEPMDWTVEEQGKVRASVSQLPLRLAWAITVHKSQGMSLDEAVMDLSDVFEFGQGYVALSRVRRLSGLYLIGWNERAFQVHPEVLAQDAAFREASRVAEQEFSKIILADAQKKRADLVTASATGKISEQLTAGKKKTGGGVSYAKIREQHPNAYQLWDKGQDEQLRELFANDLSIADLAKKFSRKPGAIRARLMKMGLLHDSR